MSFRHAAIVLLAGSLAGCSYAMFDSVGTSAGFSSSGKEATQIGGSGPDGETTGSTGTTSGRADAAAMASLFTRASEEKAAPAPPPVAAAPVAKPAVGVKPVVLADADPAIAVTPPAAADKYNAEPHGRAYLFRGIAGLIYSRGMDKLADRIKRVGVPSDVETYLVWRPIVEQAIRDYRRDPQPITLIGHSMGGDSALAFAETLNAEHIPVSLLVTYDPSRIADDVPPNVERYINIFQSSNLMGGGNVVQGARFHGHYASYNLKDHSELVHINIEKADRIQEQLVTKVKELAATPATAEGEAVPIRLEVPADAAVELWDSGTPVSAHAGDTLKTIAATYRVPLWSLNQLNSSLADTTLSDRQRVIVPRHLVPMAAATAVSSYAPAGR